MAVEKQSDKPMNGQEPNPKILRHARGIFEALMASAKGRGHWLALLRALDDETISEDKQSVVQGDK